MAPVDDYHALMRRVGDWSGLTDSMLHVNAGLAIYVASMLVFRGKGPPIALAAIIAFETFDTLMDRAFFGTFAGTGLITQWVAALFWPLILSAVSLFCFPIIRGRRKAHPVPDDA